MLPPSTSWIQAITKCPVSTLELQNIRAGHTILASTGCTRDFCQAGRAVHTDEPRVGENRELHEVELDAREFLEEMHREGFYDGEDAFRQRLGQALEEIRAGASDGVVREDHSYAKVGGIWTQTPQELEFGVRRAWRNSRKCIMRSHCEELKLCDLRGVTSSSQMAAHLIRGIQNAFNHGSIQPTVFVFPPRAIDSRGPMILNHQILQFAGYESENGTVMGDPMSIELTKTIIELGWEPPTTRGRWDLLPLVTMADNDSPFLAELPANIRKLVHIRHPKYAAEFEALDLRWGSFPALTRLGFDIGGVQYTAAPFIGWFIDAEIGVRDLADTFRYNALPDIVHGLGLTEGKFRDGIEDFEDLPEYEKLAMLSKAQAELNYAVYWSFLEAKIIMTDSLTASMKWCKYDDDFRQKNGYRLPADPYWLAPPQGSIIPLWHRGGAPNYQPKPMICKHVQDPINTWNREKHRWPSNTQPLQYVPLQKEEESLLAQKMAEEVLIHGVKQENQVPTQRTVGELAHSNQAERKEKCVSVQSMQKEQVLTCKVKDGKTHLDCDLQLLGQANERICPRQNANRSISIYFCSSGTIAEKLAIKLHKWMKTLVKNAPSISLQPHVEPLNRLKAFHLTANKILLLVVSSTGLGEVPANGSAFAGLCNQISLEPTLSFKRKFNFAIFGNGDSRYSISFNGAAVKFNDHLRRIGGIPLAGGLFKGDTAVSQFPLRALKTWCTKLELSVAEIDHHLARRPLPLAFTSYERSCTATILVNFAPTDDAVRNYDDHQEQLLSTLKRAVLVAARPEVQQGDFRSLLLTLSISNEKLEEMSCIQILPLNAPIKVQRALLALHVEGSTRMDLALDGDTPNYWRFLTEFVDLEIPFLKLKWLESIESFTREGLTKEVLERLSVLEVLERLHCHVLFSQDQIDTRLRHDICQDMPLLRTRNYSLASSHHYTSNVKGAIAETGHKVDMMVKVLPTGRFSNIFMKDSPIPSPLQYRIVDSMCGPQLRKNHLAPFVIVSTGAGFGPVRALLQWRIATACNAFGAGQPRPQLGKGLSLFLGLKEDDVELTLDVLNEAMAHGLIDVLDIVLSNPEKLRVYDNLPRYSKRVREKLLKGRGMVFVCANGAAARGARETFGKVLGGSPAELLGERFVEEVF